MGHATLLSKVSDLGGDERVRVECHVCGYKCVPQWLNDEAHFLKCQAVLKKRPSVHQRSPVGSNPARSGSRRATTPARVGAHVATSGKLVGPERFFYDKSTYTGTHAKGGPSPVAKGSGTGFDQSWKRNS